MAASGLIVGGVAIVPTVVAVADGMEATEQRLTAFEASARDGP